MKLVCTKENLKKGLFMVSRVVGVGNPLQVLNNILIKTDNGRIKLSSTNLEIGVNTWVGGKVETEGALTVPAKIINEYINNLPTEKVSLTSKDTNLNIESNNYHTSIKGLSADDFPLIPKVEEQAFAKVDTEELKNALLETAWAGAHNETQPEISGIYFSFEENLLTIAATDRYRLAERTCQLKSPVGQKREVIIPSRTISELYKILGSGQKEVEIYFSESQVLFKFNDTELISRLIDGQYPDYKQIIPKEFQTEVVVGREDLIYALKAAALFASESSNVTMESVENKGLTITASSAQAGENTTDVPAKVKGPNVSAVFNFRYLLDCLNSLTQAKVTLKLINDNSPAMIVPEGRSNYIYIVMPIKI